MIAIFKVSGDIEQLVGVRKNSLEEEEFLYEYRVAKGEILFDDKSGETDPQQVIRLFKDKMEHEALKKFTGKERPTWDWRENKPPKITFVREITEAERMQMLGMPKLF